MRRMTVTFPKNYFSQLQENADKKGVSLAHHVRDLVDMGRQVEEATAQQVVLSGTKNKTTSALGDTKELWKNTLLYVLESRYLIRYLVDNLSHQPSEKRDAVLSAVKKKAQTSVADLLKDE